MIWKMEVVNKMSLPLIDLATEIAQWAAAKYGRQVRSATISALTKVQGQMNTAIEYITNLGTDTETIQQSAIQAAAQAAAAAENANQALENVEEVRQDLADRVASGEFDGAPGEQGPPGPQGESGLMVPTSGMFSLYLDSATGDLYAEYPDGSTPPQFEYDSESGNLYFITDDSGD